MISVIIPTHNRRELLLRAIDSVLKQTHADLECIVVDDASTDGTQTAVLDIADERVRYVRLPENVGACAARSRGVDMARGEYIAFQDSDDVWHAGKLERQLALLEESGADVTVCAMRRMLPGGKTEVFPGRDEDEFLRREELLLENLCSSQCIMGRAEALRDVRFDPEMPRLQDWEMMLRLTMKYRVLLGHEPLVDVYVQPDSISRKPALLLAAQKRMLARFHGDIVRRDALIVRGERVDVRWLRSMELAAADCGAELWTQDVLDMAPEWVLRRGEAGEAERICIVHGGQPERTRMEKTLTLFTCLQQYTPAPGTKYLPLPLLWDVLQQSAGRLTFDGDTGCTDQDNHLSGAARMLPDWLGPRRTWELLSGVYGGMAAAAELSAQQLMDMPRFASALQGIELPVRTGPVKRIGFYYHNLGHGGVQRVAAALAQEWVRMGYQVTAITTREALDGDYPLPEEVQRRVIPAFDHQRPERRRAHVQELVRSAKSCDVLVYHAWADPMILWDLLAVRSVGVRFLVHTHSVFTMPLLEKTTFDRFLCLPEVYALADGVVTLSETDKCYWDQVNARVYATVNPMTFAPEETANRFSDGRTLLWVGRMTEEKNPVAAIEVMKRLASLAPECRLIMVGTGEGAMMGRLRSLITANGLEKHVELAGWQQDMRLCYERADVLLCTSRYEGYGLALAEAFAFGIPCVTFDMPYLTTLQGGGHLSVPQGDVEGMARAALRLLRDTPFRQQLGREAIEHARTRLTVDQQAVWKRIMDDQIRGLPPMVLTGRRAVMLRTLREHVAMSREQQTAAGAVQPSLTAFVPLPEAGPARTLRKKAATFLQVLLIEGPAGVRRVLREKREDKKA